MAIRIPDGVEHSLSKFEGPGNRKFELAVVQARSNQLMGCNAFLDFGVGVVDGDPGILFKLRAEDESGYTHYSAQIDSPRGICSAVYEALVHAQPTHVHGMWINCSDEVADLFEFNTPGERTVLFDGMAEGVQTYWLGVCRDAPDEHVGSVIIGAAADMYNALGGRTGIASLVNPLMTSGGVLKVV